MALTSSVLGSLPSAVAVDRKFDVSSRRTKISCGYTSDRLGSPIYDGQTKSKIISTRKHSNVQGNTRVSTNLLCFVFIILVIFTQTTSIKAIFVGKYVVFRWFDLRLSNTSKVSYFDSGHVYPMDFTLSECKLSCCQLSGMDQIFENIYEWVSKKRKYQNPLEHWGSNPANARGL